MYSLKSRAAVYCGHDISDLVTIADGNKKLLASMSA